MRKSLTFAIWFMVGLVGICALAVLVVGQRIWRVVKVSAVALQQS